MTDSHDDDAGPQMRERPFPIVGIGASAGGLEAFTEVLRQLPADTGMAFVFIQHLDATHESMLPEILARATPMPVLEATHGAKVAPDHVWVCSPQTDLTLTDGTWRHVPRRHVRGVHMPIDLFLRTLADVQSSQAIAVILSGSNTDGTLGLKSIKEHGGFTLVQEPASAKFDGMPRSAIATGLVDFVDEPAAIGRELSRLARSSCVVRAPDEPDHPPADGEMEEQRRIFSLLRRQTRIDFELYKKPTLLRRIRRRMALRRVENLEAYGRLLGENSDELQALFHDLLINVTSFFRDPPLFEKLSAEILPAMLKEKEEDQDAVVRAWVPGCSTGEEAYSIAICLLECAGQAAVNPEIQIFATDVSAASVATARAGIYPDSIAQDVSPERLGRFFVPVDGGYQVSKPVRDMCVFAEHSLTRDPPLSRLDLISCRNVLIYLEPPLQKRLMAVFQYALKPSGRLVLGSSESAPADMFFAVDRDQKIYGKKSGGNAPFSAIFPPLSSTATDPSADGTAVSRVPRRPGSTCRRKPTACSSSATCRPVCSWTPS